MPIRCAIRGNTYSWAPSRSTPSVRTPLAELNEIVALSREHGRLSSIVDFGCGNGRNLLPLSQAFRHVFLVEDHENVERLERHAADLGVKHCTILSWDDYVRSPLKVDVVLICCVIHTVPSVQLRRTIIEVNREKLRPNRPLFIVSPKHDSKYRPTVLKGVQRFRDGIVRLYEETRTFSFYRNYTRLEIETFVDRAGLTIVKRIRSRDRYVYMALPSAP